jgi:hypothetical protein
MIDFTRAELSHFAIHYVGNKGLGEEITLSEELISFKDDFVKETLLRYFLNPFKTDIYHKFREKADVSLKSVANMSEDLFASQKNFLSVSKKLAKYLHDQSIHPKIKGGEFYVCYFKDAMVDGELCDAIGYFKTENKETYLKVYQHLNSFDVECDDGIDIYKLDKGALVFNTEKAKGYKLSIIDNNNRNAECALYWEEEFLGAKLKENGYYFTKNFMDASRGFCEEVLTEGNSVTKQDQMMMLNKSASFFKEKDHFNMKDFEKEVLIDPGVINAFSEYRHNFNERNDLHSIDEFDVSPTAVKKNAKYMRSVVKLDKNFHLYIHGQYDYVERGFDEGKGMKYYKLYYMNES